MLLHLVARAASAAWGLHDVPAWKEVALGPDVVAVTDEVTVLAVPRDASGRLGRAVRLPLGAASERVRGVQVHEGTVLALTVDGPPGPTGGTTRVRSWSPGADGWTAGPVASTPGNPWDVLLAGDRVYVTTTFPVSLTPMGTVSALAAGEPVDLSSDSEAWVGTPSALALVHGRTIEAWDILPDGALRSRFRREAFGARALWPGDGGLVHLASLEVVEEGTSGIPMHEVGSVLTVETLRGDGSRAMRRTRSGPCAAAVWTDADGLWAIQTSCDVGGTDVGRVLRGSWAGGELAVVLEAEAERARPLPDGSMLVEHRAGREGPPEIVRLVAGAQDPVERWAFPQGAGLAYAVARAADGTLVVEAGGLAGPGGMAFQRPGGPTVTVRTEGVIASLCASPAAPAACAGPRRWHEIDEIAADGARVFSVSHMGLLVHDTAGTLEDVVPFP